MELGAFVARWKDIYITQKNQKIAKSNLSSEGCEPQIRDQGEEIRQATRYIQGMCGPESKHFVGEGRDTGVSIVQTGLQVPIFVGDSLGALHPGQGFSLTSSGSIW